MHHVIKLLETLGADAKYSATAERALQLETLDDTEIRDAIQTEHITELESLLGVRSNVVCAIFAPEDEPDQTPEEEPEEQPEDESDNKTEKQSNDKLCGAA